MSTKKANKQTKACVARIEAEDVRILDEVAARTGIGSRASALRFIIREHQRMTAIPVQRWSPAIPPVHGNFAGPEPEASFNQRNAGMGSSGGLIGNGALASGKNAAMVKRQVEIVMEAERVKPEPSHSQILDAGQITDQLYPWPPSDSGGQAEAQPPISAEEVEYIEQERKRVEALAVIENGGSEAEFTL